MNQTKGGNFRKKESLLKAFQHSCLGRAIVISAILAVLAFIAAVTCPSEEYMRAEMDDNIRQCIEEHDSINIDWTEVLVMNTRYMFTTADSVEKDPESMRLFEKYNRTEYYNHTLFATMHIYNSFYIEGKRCGIGIFGLVIPIVNFNDFLLRIGPAFKEYKQPNINSVLDQEEYFGENPDLGGVFEYHGE